MSPSSTTHGRPTTNSLPLSGFYHDKQELNTEAGKTRPSSITSHPASFDQAPPAWLPKPHSSGMGQHWPAMGREQQSLQGINSTWVR